MPNSHWPRKSVPQTIPQPNETIILEQQVGSLRPNASLSSTSAKWDLIFEQQVDPLRSNKNPSAKTEERQPLRPRKVSQRPDHRSRVPPSAKESQCATAPSPPV
ncbi:unnamed protein product [Cuscuta europaea]|uniref:Uncharacterized protein n=1 Tax=Cuscuta europaea TaxID=41803 RepID=A0A9P0Z6F9_CUSEU|nr:unnamed protein product [Cuscuta europaea]